MQCAAGSETVAATTVMLTSTAAPTSFDAQDTQKKRPRPGSDNARFHNKNKPSHALKVINATDKSHLALPIHSYRSEIIEAVRQHRTTVIVGETGSGKSTQLPQILLESGIVPRDKGIVCTQPRRVAAVTIAQKVASERGVAVGQEVGYSIRFEDKTSAKTRIKYVTDGVLLRESMTDASLSKYSILILDEAHERSLQTDILLGLIKMLQDKRHDDNFRVIIMSATLQVEVFRDFFDNSCSVVIPGRQFPVELMYLKEPESDYVEASLLTCLQIYEEEEPGGVLVFLPGQEDIESLQQLLIDHLCNAVPMGGHKHIKVDTQALKQLQQQQQPETISEENGSVVNFLEDEAKPYEVRVLYAAMPSDEQLQVFERVPKGVRLFILATNIAETSLTISGVKYVVDTGFVKMRLIHPVTGFDMLKTTPVSQSQANQRCGRAGRECAGKCYRLYTESSFKALSQFTVPEVQRIDLCQVLLQLMAQGIRDIVKFPWLTKPSGSALKTALTTLLNLGALDNAMNMTKHGELMSRLPLHPSLSHLLLASMDLKCIAEALTAVALLSAENVYVQPHTDKEKQKALSVHRAFASVDGDLCTLINIYAAYVQAKKDLHWVRRNYLSIRALKLADNIRDQLSALLRALNISKEETSCWPTREPFLRCLVQGLYLNIAQRVTTQGNGRLIQSSKPDEGRKQLMGRQAYVNNSNAAPYETIRGRQPVYIHPTSTLFALPAKKLPAVVVYAELLTTTKQYMRNVNVIAPEWLQEMMPQVFKAQSATVKVEISEEDRKAREEEDRIRRMPVGKVISA